VEALLAELWSEVLGVEGVGRRDNFFELGGHSLLAVRLIQRMRRHGMHAGVQALFITPTLAELAAAVGGESGEVRVPPNGIPTPCDAITPAMLPLVELSQAEIDGIVAGVEGGAANVQDVYPLAPLQEGILFHHLAAAEGDPYLMSGLYGFDARERLDAYVAALRAVIARHDVLRTAVVWEGLREPVQVVWREAPLRVDEVELDADGGDAAHALWARFDPRHHRIDVRRAPLVRVHVARDGDRWLLLLRIHHLLSDHTALEVLQAEVHAHMAGRAGELGAALPFRDYVAQARLGVSRQEHEAFFRELLSGVDEPTAPFGLLDAWGDGSGIEEARLPVDGALAARLRERARRLGVSAASVCHLAWARVLACVSGRDDVVFGTVLFGRMQGGEGADRVLGPFINTLPVRVRVGADGVEAAARATHRQLAELLRHEHASLALAQRCSQVEAPAPLFTSLLNYRHARGSARAPQAGHAREGIRALHGQTRTNYPVTLSIDDLGEGLALNAFAPAAVGPRRLCAMMHRALESLVDALDTSPGRALARVEVLPHTERRQVLELWNATDAGPVPDVCLHEPFEAQAQRAPGAVALVFEGQALTYAELDARANRLAHHLRALGVGPDVRVGLCLERGLEMMVGLLAVLKSGGAYVALDPEYPRERLAYMLADSAPAVLLTQSSLLERLGATEVPVVALDRDAAAWAELPCTAPGRGGLTPAHLAYVIYTSGSTGLPKGVPVEHRSVVNVLAWMQEAWPLHADDVVLQKTPYSFDASLRELIPPLMAGARMVIARPGGHRDPAYLLHTVRAQGVTTLHFVPSMLQVLVGEPALAECTTLRRVVCGGEALPRDLVRRFHARLPGTRLFNVYGPTEAAVDVTARSCAPDADEGHVPIGRPMANVRVYLLDAAGEPVPAGVAGELYVGGVQVARGYLGRPRLTAERFVPDPFGPEAGARLYRTGDLARWLPDGSIDFLGRGDAQVKIRGFRIELGEIEARLAEHPGVREAVVVARADAAGDRRLVAYFVGDAAAEALRAHLAAALPEHMVPSAYVALERMPRTPGGKLDRRALPAPEGDAFARQRYEPPATDTELALAELWSGVLGVERVGRWDHFFELGGHSLRAVQVISRVRQVLGAEVALGELFERPVLADFARGLEDAARSNLPAIEPADRGGRLPLSYSQQRLWFLEQLGGMGGTYHIPKRLRLRGVLDAGALGRALDRIVERHEALRTVFQRVDGEPVQRIAPAGGFRLAAHDLEGHADAAAELRRLVAEETREPFHLEHGPLVRGRLIRLAADDHVLLITMHHIVSDAWSTGVLIHELNVLYRAFRDGAADPLPPLPVQYADYAAWQRQWVEGEVLEAQAAYWTRTLAGAPELLELPTDRARSARQDHAGAWLGVELDEELTAGLRALGQRHGATLFMTLLAGWAAVLGRLSGQAEVVVGTPTANRGRREIEGLIGFFLNTLALRVDLAGSPTVAELLARVKARALEAQQNQDIPFEQVVERVQAARSLAHSPVFQVMFTWQNTPRDELRLPGLELRPLEGSALEGAASEGTAKFDLSLAMWEAEGRIAGRVEYATALFDPETAERFASYLRRVLEAMVADEGARVDQLELLPPAERTRVVREWNATDAPYPRHLCVHQLFEAQARRTPAAEAVVYEGETLTYAELDARANRLAHHLRALGVGPDVRVGLCLERSLGMVVGLLAVLKAGGAYVALDPEYPQDRVRYMLADSAPAVLLTQSSLLERLGALEVPVVALDRDAAMWAELPCTAPADGGLTPEHLVYVIYTSGSTGLPKGVMNVHRNVVNRISWMQSAWVLDASESVLQNASLSFDVSAYEFFWPLMVGGRVVMARPEGHKDPGYLLETIRAQGVGTASFVPSMLQLLLEHPGVERCTGLLRVPCGGEALPPALVRRFYERLPNARLYNRYGPSEAATAVTGLSRAGEERRASVPIGQPVSNTRVYVLDGAGEPVPVGVVGEMYIGGAGVGRGYLDRPGLTAERFVPDPFSPEPGARLYRTGDVGRWLADGRIEFLGRNDAQAKIRGFRVEPGEIEARLAEHPGVREAAVLVREDTPGDRRLVAYFVGRADAEGLRAHLKERLPEYMVPAAYVGLERMPLSPNGKLDRLSLPAPEGNAYARGGYEAPATETEVALAEIWSEVLGVERVGRGDGFFELGGHSLLASKLAFRVKQDMDADLALSDIFGKPVLWAMAQQIVDAQLGEFDPEELARLAEMLAGGEPEGG
jgi:amino acid adenylation domain-containing protein